MITQLPLQFTAHSQAVFCVAFNPDGNRLAAGTGSLNAVGELLFYPINAAATSNDFAGEPDNFGLNQHRPLTKNTEIQPSREILQSANGLSTTALHFTPDAKHLWVATGNTNSSSPPLLCFNLATGKPEPPASLNIQNTPHTHPDGFLHIDEHLFVCCHSIGGYADQYIYHFMQLDVAKASSQSNRLLFLDGHIFTPNNHAHSFGLSVAPIFNHIPAQKAQQIATHNTDKTDVDSVFRHKLTQFIPVEHQILCMAQQPCRTLFTTGDTAGKFQHWWFNGQWQHYTFGPEALPTPTTPLVLTESLNKSSTSVMALQYLPNDQGWLSLHANGMLIYWQDEVILRAEQISTVGSPCSLACHPNATLLAIGLKNNAKDQGSGIILVDISQWLLDTASKRHAAQAAKNAPDDKFFYTPNEGLPPRPIREQVSKLTNLALAVREDANKLDALKALLANLQNEPHFSSGTTGNPAFKLQAFKQQLEHDVLYTCHWWEESWRHQCCWPIIASVLNNRPLPLPKKHKTETPKDTSIEKSMLIKRSRFDALKKENYRNFLFMVRDFLTPPR